MAIRYASFDLSLANWTSDDRGAAVDVVLTNVGSKTGATVVQLYAVTRERPPA